MKTNFLKTLENSVNPLAQMQCAQLKREQAAYAGHSYFSDGLESIRICAIAATSLQDTFRNTTKAEAQILYFMRGYILAIALASGRGQDISYEFNELSRIKSLDQLPIGVIFQKGAKNFVPWTQNLRSKAIEQEKGRLGHFVTSIRPPQSCFGQDPGTDVSYATVIFIRNMLKVFEALENRDKLKGFSFKTCYSEQLAIFLENPSLPSPR